jgi:3'-5' exoribonuclease
MSTTVQALQPGEPVEEAIFLLVNPQARENTNGKPYLRCMLRDSTGEVACRWWTFDPSALPGLERSSVVAVDGDVVSFKGQKQLHVKAMRPLEATPQRLKLLLPTSSRDNDEMFGEVRSLLDTIGSPSLRGLIDAVFDDDPLIADFRTAPAAMTMHHAWIGGLMEHTSQMMRIGDAVVRMYVEAGVKLDRDIVLVGLFFHDLAKTTELSWRDGFGYTVRGNLIGHIVDGAQLIEAKATEAELAGAEPLHEDDLMVLQNIVLSHHGRAEYGAAKPPMTPEAVLVARIDELEAHTRMAVDAVDGQARGMTEMVRGLGNRLFARGT